MWWQASRLVLAMLLGQAVPGVMAASSYADPVGDARIVYCVKPDNARPLVDTAVVLGLADRGKGDARLTPTPQRAARDLTVEQWRQVDPVGFDRACAALVASLKLPVRSSERSKKWLKDLVTTLIGLIPVVVGGALALGSALVTTRKATSQRAAGELHAVATAYVRACRACLAEWVLGRGRALQNGMDAPLDALLAELRRCTSRHPGWEEPKRLGEAIEKLDEAIRDTTWPKDELERRDKVKDYRERLDEVHQRALGVVAALERPLWNYRKMRSS